MLRRSEVHGFRTVREYLGGIAHLAAEAADLLDQGVGPRSRRSQLGDGILGGGERLVRRSAGGGFLPSRSDGLRRGLPACPLHDALLGLQGGLRPGGCGARANREPLEEFEPKQVREDLAPLLRVPDQEVLELALRQDHRAGERVVVEPDGPLDQGIRRLDLVRSFARRAPAVRGPRLEPDLRRTAQGRRSRDQPPGGAHLELEGDRHPRLAERDEGTDRPTNAVQARHLAE